MEKTKVQELNILNSYYKSGKNQILIVYGHIKTGSIDMLDAFASDKESMYYCACSASDRLQRHIWGNDIRGKGCSVPPCPEYTEIFENYVRIADAKERPLVIFIENFEDIIKSSPNFLDEISKIVYKDDHQQLMVVLLGDNASWIENNMVDKIGAQASVISGFLKIKPYSFQEMKKRYSEMDDADAVRTYSVLGGNASLWEYFDYNKSFKQNVIEKFLDERSSVLIRLTSITLEENLRETAVYNTILYGLANGKNKLNDIHHATGFSRAKIMVYLKSLIDLGMVEKVFSFATTGHENVQKGVYRIIDPLAAFYYRFLYVNSSQIIKMDPENFYDIYISEGLPEYVNFSFRLVCREYIMKMSEYGRFPFVIEEEGEWVGKMGTINIVARSETGDTMVALTSWNKTFTLDSLEFLRGCSKRARLNPDYYYMFSAAGFDDELKKLASESDIIKLIDLEELMNG